MYILLCICIITFTVSKEKTSYSVKKHTTDRALIGNNTKKLKGFI